MVGAAMAAAIVLAFTAIRRREVAEHRAWMIRAYALGLGAGTLVFTQLPWIPIAGPLDRPAKALLMGAGWAINVVVAERIMGVGLTRPKGRVAGIDAAGRVEAVGADVTGVRPGDEVLGFCPSALAEYARTEADKVVPNRRP
jgi:hypothetical protein